MLTFMYPWIQLQIGGKPFTGLNLASYKAPLLYLPFTPRLLRKNKILKFILILIRIETTRNKVLKLYWYPVCLENTKSWEVGA